MKAESYALVRELPGRVAPTRVVDMRPRVPASSLIGLGRRPSGTLQQPISLVDIAPTISRFLGLLLAVRRLAAAPELLERSPM